MTGRHLTIIATALALGIGTPAVAQTNAMSAGQGSLSAQDRSFMTTAAQGGMAEVQTAQLAVSKSTNPKIKTFAQKMIADHGKANKQLMTIAQAKNVTLPTSIGPSNTMQKDSLTKLTGTTFDTAYLTGQKSAHASTASLFSKEIASGKDATVVAFAKTVLPTVKQHEALIATDLAAISRSTSGAPARHSSSM